MAVHNELGKTGEEYAADLLLAKGYEIVERNWLRDKYEVDIIAIDKKEIVFVEVKTRSSSMWGEPVDSVSQKRMKRMENAADLYLSTHEIALSPRFDIISVVINGEEITIEHIDDAFLPSLD